MATSEPPPVEEVPEERSVAQTVAEILAAGLAIAAASKLISAALAPLRIGVKAVKAALHAFLGGLGNRKPDLYSGWFVLNSARRVQRGLSDGVPLKDLAVAEVRYSKQHHAAQTQRRKARIDARKAATASHRLTGERVFRWRYSQLEGDCTPIQGVYCRDLDGQVFPIDNPPQGKLPGERHPNCRCRAIPVAVISYT